MSPAERLAAWFVVRHQPITHLKLQKLCFYGYGAACAFGFVDELGGVVRFEAWKHGPVCRAVWRAYKHHGAAEITAPLETIAFSKKADAHLDDVLAVYGHLSAWRLAAQTHLERPHI